jgi:DNA-entry nuclease
MKSKVLNYTRENKKMNKRIRKSLLSIIVVLSVVFTSVEFSPGSTVTVYAASYQKTYTKNTYGVFKSNPYKVIHGNEPYFTKKQKKNKKAFEKYSKLDTYGRCGVAFANVCKEIMPTSNRGEIGTVKPSGWHTVKYPGVVSGNYLYNRCHLIGYQLSGENANPKNLITGTRYLNVTGMLPFENEVNDYVDSTGNHVLYRVTPIYKGSELVARGVLMEAYSVEDSGKGVKFCVFCYNAQPQITIDYATGDSKLKGSSTDSGTTDSGSADSGSADSTKQNVKTRYILCLSTKKFHKPSCRYVARISINNKKTVKWSRSKVIKKGYAACKVCKP